MLWTSNLVYKLPWVILHDLKVAFSPKLWNPRMAHPDWNKRLTDVKSLFVYFPMIVKCCFCLRFFVFFVSWPVIFFLSCSISIIFGFSHYALFSLDIISQFLFLSIYQSYRSKSLDWLTDKDVYIISWHTFVCLFHCHFVFLPIWVIFPPTHTQDAENIQVVFAFFCS